MLGPLLVSTVVGNAVASGLATTPSGKAAGRVVAGIGAVAVSGELLGWALRNPEHPASKALSWPGQELQHRVLTAEPSDEQLEVARAALDECLRLERAALQTAR
jgi:uncharacterized protein YqhQ